MNERRAIGSLRLHPDAEKVPRPSSTDLAALRASLRDDGQQDPIDVTPDGQILDGRTRWELLRDLGALDIEVRVHDLPVSDQTNYIIARVLTRRHLTNEQKRALNDLMRVQVVEVATHPKTGEEMRIGVGQSQRAERLGVRRETVRDWDKDGVAGVNTPPASSPTHFREEGRGRVMPLHPDRKPREATTTRKAAERPAPLRKSRPIPYWSRHFTFWCRGSRPEDRDFLRRIDREIHAALKQNGIACQEEAS